jgi:hypothetical protein
LVLVPVVRSPRSQLFGKTIKRSTKLLVDSFCSSLVAVTSGRTPLREAGFGFVALCLHGDQSKYCSCKRSFVYLGFGPIVKCMA